MASDKHIARLIEGASAWNKWRREEPLVRPDLQGMSLSLAQKQWGETSGGPINFAQSMLRDADLRHATLIRADLAGASLNGANLSGARLQNANLRNANLSRVRFDGADLADALLDGADLRGADLSGARNLSPRQIETAEGDAKTLLPAQFVPPRTWHNGAHAQPAASASGFGAKGAAEATSPVTWNRKLAEPNRRFSDRAGEVARMLPRPDLAGMRDRAVQSVRESIPKPDLAGMRDRAVQSVRESIPKPDLAGMRDRAVQSVRDSIPRPDLAGMRDRAVQSVRDNIPKPDLAGMRDRAVQSVRDSIPRPKFTRVRDFTARTRKRLPGPKLAMSVGFVALGGLAGFALLLGVARLIELKQTGALALNKSSPEIVSQATPPVAQSPPQPSEETSAESEPVPTIAAQPDASPAVDQAPPSETEPNAAAETAPPPKVAQTEPARTEAAPIKANQSERAQGRPAQAEPAPAVAAAEPAAPPKEEAPERMQISESVTAAPVHPVEDKGKGAAAADANGAALVETKTVPARPVERVSVPNSKTQALPLDGLAVKPATGGTSRLNFTGQAGQTPAVHEPIPAADGPKPDKPDASKSAAVKKPKPAAASAQPNSVVGYLSTPQKSTEWVKVFIKDFYLSGSALDESEIRRIYSDPVEYFGDSKMTVAKVARAKSAYYRLWPQRSYDLVPGSITVKWKSDGVADVSFVYHYKVSNAGNKTGRGRGRAHLTLDLTGPAGVIVREDGEVIAHN